MKAHYNTKVWYVNLTGIGKNTMYIAALRHLADALRIIEPGFTLERAKNLLDGLTDPNQHGHPIAIAEGVTKRQADKIGQELFAGGLQYDIGRPGRQPRMRRPVFSRRGRTNRS